MVMQHILRITASTLIATGMAGGARAMEDAPHNDVQGAGQAEYKRADANFYGRGDVLRAHPSAIVIKPDDYTKTGDSYFFTPKIKAPKDMYAETVSDWIEPITPPDMPASLGVPPDAMQVREPQGDVQVALPTAPANFSPVTAGMTLPNGAVLKTGDGGTVAVLFGGVDSARLMPNSEAAVQQTVTADSRTAEVDLTAGGVFSKVGTQVGVKGTYEVHTPNAHAVAQGGDFVTIIANARTDVWVAQGSVQLNETDGKTGPTATSDGKGPLKVMRLPSISDPHASFLADTETLSMVLNFIPLADQKIKGLRDKASSGTPLTTNEQAYLARLKKVPCVIKLALVEPPKPEVKPALVMEVAPLPPPAPAPLPSPTPAPAPIAPATPVPMASAPAEAPATPATPEKPKPIILRVRTDGKINYQKATFTLEQLRPKLVALAKAAPDQAIAIRAGKTVSYDEVEPVLAVCRDVGFHNINVSAPPPTAAFNPPEPAEHPADNLPAPGLLMHPSMEPRTGNAPSATSTPDTTTGNTPATNAPSTSVP